MRYTVVLTGTFPDTVTAMLSQHVDVVAHASEESRSEEDMITLLAEADAAIVLPTDPVTPRVLEESPNLRFVAVAGEGEGVGAAGGEGTDSALRAVTSPSPPVGGEG